MAGERALAPVPVQLVDLRCSSEDAEDGDDRMDEPLMYNGQDTCWNVAIVRREGSDEDCWADRDEEEGNVG